MRNFLLFIFVLFRGYPADLSLSSWKAAGPDPFLPLLGWKASFAGESPMEAQHLLSLESKTEQNSLCRYSGTAKAGGGVTSCGTE